MGRVRGARISYKVNAGARLAQRRIAQPLGAHELGDVAALPPPLTFEAKIETLRRTWMLPRSKSIPAKLIDLTESCVTRLLDTACLASVTC